MIRRLRRAIARARNRRRYARTDIGTATSSPEFAHATSHRSSRARVVVHPMGTSEPVVVVLPVHTSRR